jgi:hypothetical protein
MNVFRLKNGNYTNQKFDEPGWILVVLGLACIAISPMAQAVVPAPDGGYPGGNTAEGQTALLSLTTGGFNTAVGWRSLRSNTTGSFNTASGAGTLVLNTADENTATGAGALLSNTTGIGNTAHGAFALINNTTGIGNTALGDGAGFNVTTADNVICIGASILGANVDNSCFIGQIYSNLQPVIGNDPDSVTINSSGRLGRGGISSRRYKHDIKPMDKASEVLFALKPVSFHYNKEYDATQTLAFGLIAEEVAEVDPNLVGRNPEGQPQSVRYEQINAMLLNEFLKEHKAFLEEQRKVQEQETTIARLKKEMKALVAHAKEQDSKIQRVSAQIDMSKAAPQMVVTDR